VDELLGQLAQIPPLSPLITCRGTDLPPLVEWSNISNAVLEPFSPEAALLTFQDRAGRQLTGQDIDIAKKLFSAVNRVPLTISLLGQLARRGNSVANLLLRWNCERTSLLHRPYQQHGRVYSSVDRPVERSRRLKGGSPALSLCSTLPDGLRPNVFERLRPQFKYIDRARDNLSAYSLACPATDDALQTLSPVRHHVLQHHHPQPEHRKALCLVYFGIAEQLPTVSDEDFKERAAVAAPEIGNLSSLLLTLVDEPSAQVVDAVIQFTDFEY